MGGPTVSGELIAMITNCHQDHKIMAWLSPAYPIGSYSFSHGLEEAITRKIVNDKDTLHDWLFQILRLGLGRNDAILLSNAFRANRENLLELGWVAEAFAGSKERHEESLQQGLAFSKVTSFLCRSEIPQAPLPIAIGYAAKIENIGLERLLPLYLHSISANLISAAVRFLPLGQTDGQVVLYRLFEECDKLASETIDLGLDQLANSCFLNDLGSMKHETMNTRIFRS